MLKFPFYQLNVALVFFWICGSGMRTLPDKCALYGLSLLNYLIELISGSLYKSHTTSYRVGFLFFLRWFPKIHSIYLLTDETDFSFFEIYCLFSVPYLDIHCLGVTLYVLVIFMTINQYLIAISSRCIIPHQRDNDFAQSFLKFSVMYSTSEILTKSATSRTFLDY